MSKLLTLAAHSWASTNKLAAFRSIQMADVHKAAVDGIQPAPVHICVLTNTSVKVFIRRCHSLPTRATQWKLWRREIARESDCEWEANQEISRRKSQFILFNILFCSN